VLRRLIAALGLDAATASNALAEPPYAPYANDTANSIYNLLFCDERDAFKPKPGESPVLWQATLFSAVPDSGALGALAADPTQDGRIRYLAYARLRELKQPVPRKVLLGVIVELPLPDGLDVLAAFSDGGVRYLNQTGKLAVFEGADSLRPLVQRLLDASELVIERIGPWGNPRRAPPRLGTVRLSFLVSEGLFFGEGPMSVMQREAMAGPVIARAGELLQAVVSLATK
jgi:hypothetical protein